MQGVFLDLDSVHPSDLDLAQLQACLPHWQFHRHTEPDEVLARIQAADVVVTNKVPLTAPSIQASPQLRLICVAATGTNNIDLAAASAAGVVVSNATDYATASVVEHVFAMLLTLSRRLDGYRRRVHAGDWTNSPHFCLFDETIDELAEKRLGIIGYGVLGRAVANLARAFPLQVHIAQRVHDTPLPDRVPLPQLLENCDVISLHCPLTEQSRNLITRREFDLMKPSAIIINAARGGIINETDLIEALRSGRIAGAGIDCLTEEPPAPDHPMITAQLPQLIITPHNAWGTLQARQRLVDGTAANIQGYLNHDIKNQVNT